MMLGENIQIRGEYKITKTRILGFIPKTLSKLIRVYRYLGIPYIHLVRKLNQICDTEVYTASNIITTVGLAKLAIDLTLDSITDTSDIAPNDVAVGTGTTSPVVGDTTLETETTRNIVINQSSAGGKAFISAFFNETDFTGIIDEVGCFIGGDGVGPDTGTLLSRALSNVNKSSTESLTIEWTISVI